MRIVMTMMVRDEIDLIDEQIAFHLAAGVDFVVATDHESVDGTREVLERYERRGVLHLLRVTSPTKQKSERFTRMARMAAVDYGADWVINSDADEFWWPWGGDLKDVLARVPEQYGIVRTFVRPFVPRPGSGPFAERMTVRFAPAAPINSPFSPFRANVRLLHRAAPDVVVGDGNASIRAGGLRPLPARSAVEVLHFPIRSSEQFARKFVRHYETSDRRIRGEHVRAFEAAQEGRLSALYGEICVDDELLERGLDEGSLVIDERLRDALRALVADRASLQFPPRTPTDEVGYAADGSVLAAGERVRFARRADELGKRLEERERRRVPLAGRARAHLRSLGS